MTNFDAAKLKTDLDDWQVVLLDEVDSTNRFAVANADQLKAPALILAERQTAGRGRGGNRWWSADGALTFSLLLRPGDFDISGEERVRLSLLTAAVLRQSLRNLLPFSAASLQLKWPNDLYLQGRKVCGILLEQAGSNGSGLVVGVGLNVNNSWANAPEDIRDKGVALCDVLGEPVAAADLLAAFAADFLTAVQDAELRNATLAAGRQAHLLDGQIITLERSNQRLTGMCEGIDDDGALLVRDTYGLQRIHSAVILDWEAGLSGF
ncbi:biotin--[acetyl-CoA-carboxylase] ligase [Rubinisphaera brasiliensis]|uniref:biotin--[biotin carboxyl-carrier protein] ligase n=1 Tax=Rubinisphaera brasiliensis (strain ATCC 49424 / DSM 5305 / JCM 21570 / IAM 15109 / NBRC 103401 / IFAM 1448) TaxID=756272 RepID=F0SR19_RUBBR|nr:biotin--[acetyl-CoA-carboxylase] ligase [Rubinisphaera brasiliensis]ADY61266.1 biotin/acetyl-CoA-carboxylase ligase [Rubinisphaera brasiliensis DSM 5305]